MKIFTSEEIVVVIVYPSFITLIVTDNTAYRFLLLYFVRN